MPAILNKGHRHFRRNKKSLVPINKKKGTNLVSFPSKFSKFNRLQRKSGLLPVRSFQGFRCGTEYVRSLRYLENLQELKIIWKDIRVLMD